MHLDILRLNRTKQEKAWLRLRHRNLPGRLHHPRPPPRAFSSSSTSSWRSPLLPVSPALVYAIGAHTHTEHGGTQAS